MIASTVAAMRCSTRLSLMPDPMSNFNRVDTPIASGNRTPATVLALQLERDSVKEHCPCCFATAVRACTTHGTCSDHPPKSVLVAGPQTSHTWHLLDITTLQKLLNRHQPPTDTLRKGWHVVTPSAVQYPEVGTQHTYT